MKSSPQRLTLCFVAVLLGAEPALAGWRDLLPGSLSRGVQYFGARRYTRPIAPQTPPAPQRPPPPPAPSGSPVAPPLPGAAATTSTPAASTAKSKEEKEAVLKRTIDFQKKRAEEGSVSAQFDLGKRYLTGDGLAKDLPEARKWFEAAAKQGHEGAATKLEEVKKLEDAATAAAAAAAKTAK